MEHAMQADESTGEPSPASLPGQGHARFRVGDVVQLNSGGPRMTVVGYEESLVALGPIVAVTWFDDNRVEHNSFHQALLTRIE
jgi:uncharacterized protein YodC (DUF2158 family)